MAQLDRTSKISAIAAIVGGGLLLYKAIQILVTGDQPPLAFEVSPLFLAIAMYGLLVRVVKPRGLRLLISRILIGLIFVSASGGLLIVEEEGVGSKLEVVSSLFDVVSGLGPMVLLIILGLPIFKQRLWSSGWRYLPLGLGISFIPTVIVGAILEESFGERYLEIPLIFIGIAWVLIAYPLLARK
jgi:hypothetical protein